ncbi:MAG: hypothetical protein GOMPHAMPRED_001577 [Gomphillus americanus]|uniref:Uncharacterized protein n=1 Tax=Gomphillus americanus TaxID=1940652 RepID=A0A8H3F7P0_9LECA|nr:MAG: hypothetical protein GOMPHAMPRED_001577 [Gomphillus americanus]
MRHSYLLLNCCLAALVVSATNSVHTRQNVVTGDPGYMKLVPRGSPRGSSPTRESGKGSPSSSQPQRQKSPDRIGDWKGTSSATHPISPTTRSQSQSRSYFVPPGTHRLRAENRLSMENGPMRIPRSQIRRKSISSLSQLSRPESPPRPKSPPPIPNMVGGHPNSAMLIVKGPAFMQGQTASGHIEVANVPAGKYDYLNLHDKESAFVMGRTKQGGHAIAATTGNAVAGYAAVHHTATGYVETHDGQAQTWHNVTPGEEYRRHVRGDHSRRVKGAALAEVRGHGQVTAVAMESETVLG